MGILEKYKNIIHFYFKIDFGLLAVIGSVVTILKFQRIEIFSFIVEIRYLIILIIVIICFSLLIETIINLIVSEISEKEKEFKNSIKIIKGSIWFLLVFHITIFCFIGGYIIAYSEEGATHPQAEALYKDIRKGVLDFYNSNYRLPNSLDEIFQRNPHIEQQLDYDNIKVLYKIKDSLSYEIKFEGPLGEHGFPTSIVVISHPIPYNLKPIDDSIIDFYKIHKRTPYSLIELKTLNKKTSQLISEYIQHGLYYMAFDSITYELRYLGADNSINTKDDIVSIKIIKR